MTITSTTGGTILLDFQNKVAGKFKGATSFATDKHLAFGADTAAEDVDFLFEITSPDAFLHMNTPVKMSDPQWNHNTQIWQPNNIGSFWMNGIYDGSHWLVKILGPLE